MNLGTENLKLIKSSLTKKEKPNYTNVKISVESTRGWKKVKDSYWLPDELYSKFKN
jgi:hypothetical protein